MKLLLLAAATLLTGPARAQAPEPPLVPPGATLEFVANQGQWPAPVRYAAELPSGRLFAEANGVTLALLADGGPGQHNHRGAAHGVAGTEAQPLRGHALALRFAGAAPATIIAEARTAEHRSYFLGHDPAHWAADVPAYRALRYDGLWPGISARLYESPTQQLEYDFVLAPGADATAIGLRHEGADGVKLDDGGNLVVQTSVGTVVEHAPQAWQTDAAGHRRAVPCHYALANGTVQFALGQYDHSRALVIDPVVVFASYTGSAANNWGFTATYDPAGNLYSGGIAFEVGYPTTAGAFQTSFKELVDIAIIKFDTHVSGPPARVWATYLGGSSADFPASLVVNSRGELLVLGTSGSNDYPVTTNAAQQRFAGGVATDPFGYGPPYDSPNGSDLVITRLNATGTGLVGSTYLGGTGNEGLLPLLPSTSASGATFQLAHNYGDPFRGDIFVDAADNVYVASHTTSANFPVAAGLGGAYRGGTSDGVVAKLAPGLDAVRWASYLGGSGADAAYSLQVEPGSGDVYVAGGTLSPNFPTTAGAYKTTRPGNVDGFVVRIAASGTSLLRATYVGTAAYDQAYFLQLGTDGGVYLLGQTRGAFPVSPGLYTTAGGTQFIQKLDASLTQSQLATVFGSTAPGSAGQVNLDPTAFLVDRCDRVYVCGWGGMVNGRTIPNSTAMWPYLDGNGTTDGLPVTSNAAQPATDGSDFYLAQFSAGLTRLDYATFYGDTTPGTEGEHVDGGTSRFDPRGIVYEAVCSCFSTTGFPIPPGANTYSTVNGSSFPGFGANCNNAAFVLDFRPEIADAGADQSVCANAGPQPLAGNPTGGIWTGPGVSGSQSLGYVFTPSAALVGVQTLTYTVPSTGLCTTTGTRRITVVAPPAVVFTPLLQRTYCVAVPNAPVQLTATPAGGTFSGPGVSGSAATGYVFTPNLPVGTYQLAYAVTVGICTVQTNQEVVVAPQPTSALAADTTICFNSSPVALRGSPAGGVFSGPGVSGSVATGFTFAPPAGQAGPFTVGYRYTSAAGCTSQTATRRIALTAPPVLAPGWNAVPCPETQLAPLTVQFSPGSGTADLGLSWDFGDGTQSADPSPVHTYATPGTYQPRLRARYFQGRCETTVELAPVTVLERKVPNIITPNGDAQNQAFKLGPDCAPHLQVYSRWGQLVFDSPVYHDDWSAPGQPDGVYYYLLTYPDGHRVKGWVEVRR
ncbi:gliding motility-associated C-terminal domain-containing protein [Hymenobacter sp. DH14]|uniref:Gliding motility-associated C-terminal domain-containing protein n=1 Tax=Hymenobacter cyanobacteriorum TaxID=2926463 RepID=A0A9X1VHA9_9BACT|nr:gliding motility-associated C-terminal domain-containing protein [Hymenobacter cyanobacteriorum]MCI1188252.1 gliding motility-associated C-terminal domain-containing protein [Hymenobacter cyanobacteriorum]